MRTNTFLHYICFCLIIASGGCVDQISQDFPEANAQLVVEGSITTAPGPYYISIQSSESLEGLQKNRGIGSGASVMISDNQGNTEQLSEIGLGFYATSVGGIQGVVGRSYTLTIELNGKTYQSIPETIPEPAGMDSLQSQPNVVVTEDLNGVEQITEQHILSARITSDLSKKQFFKIESNGYAEVFVSSSNCPPVDGRNCWQIRENIISGVRIQDNLELAREEFRLDVTSIPFDGRGRYYAIVNLLSITERAYNFFSTIEAQLDRGDNIFQAPLSPIVGNITDNSGGQLLGYFYAASITTERICFSRNDIESDETSVPTLLCPDPVRCGGLTPPPCFDTCIDVYSNALFFPPLPLDECE
ncbi:MAG: DUF4249 domain-containing protein [Cyclobacteriaceae bacterium]|nr:DUF4249 domain-containing protein [Cyclobacteriaceae bacterium HetDA_MAG_MS6]